MGLPTTTRAVSGMKKAIRSTPESGLIHFYKLENIDFGNAMNPCNDEFHSCSTYIYFLDPYLMKQESHVHVRGAALPCGRLHRPLRHREEVGLPQEVRQRRRGWRRGRVRLRRQCIQVRGAQLVFRSVQTTNGYNRQVNYVLLSSSFFSGRCVSSV